MKTQTWGTGSRPASDLAVPTPREMEKIGAREGRDTYRRFSLFSRGQQDPIPARDDPRVPSAVHKAEGACHNEAARLADACAAHSMSIKQQIAADEDIVESLGHRDLPGPERVLPGWVNIGVLILLGFAEWMVNALAFAVFGGNNAQTYVVALVVAVLLPGCAAVVGSSWKQHRHEGLAMLSLVAALGLIVAVAFIRQAYFYDVVNSILGLNIAPWLLTIIYVVINLAMFFGGVLVSYLHAASDPEGQMERQRLEAAQQRLATNRAAQGGLRARYRAQAEDLGAQLRTLAWAYNAGNMRARRRARHAEHRLQPLWVDAIDGLDVPVPNALLDAPRTEVPAFDLDAGVLKLAGRAHGGNGNGNGKRKRAEGTTAAEIRGDSRSAREGSNASTSTGSAPIAITTYTAKEARR